MSRLLSIICPVYNSEQNLRDCILSVLNQTDDFWELVLVDDGSTDNSGFICDEFALLDKRIKVLHKKNNGQMNARIDGINYSNGQYVIFLDSDDILDKNAVSILKRSIERHPDVEAFLFNAIIFPESNNSKILPFVEKSYSLNNNFDIIQFLFGNQLFGYLWMYCFTKTRLMASFETTNFFTNIRYTEDVSFIFNVISNIKVLELIDDALYLYRNNNLSITHNLSNNDRHDRFLVFNHIYNSISSKYPNFVINNPTATMVSWSMFSYLEHIDKKNEFKRAFKESRESIICKQICRRVKTKDKKFKLYRLLLNLNMPYLFYKCTVENL